MAIDQANRLQSILDPVVAQAGLLLESVAITGPRGRQVVCVTVDLVDGPGGVGSDQLGEVSQAVSTALDDVADLIDGAYLLEVTTPGLSRPLTQARHYRRATGHLVTVQTADGAITGRVIGADEESVNLEVPQRRGAPVPTEIALAAITQGRMEIELRRPAESE